MTKRLCRCFSRASVLLLLSCLSPLATAQAEVTAEAAALLRQSIVAHGGEAPVRVRLTFRGVSESPGQAVAAEGPARPHPLDVTLAFDEKAQAVAFNNDSAIDGDFTFNTRIGFARGKGYSTRYTGEYDPLTELPKVANSFIPHLLLRDILTTVRSAKVAPDPIYKRVDFTSATGGLDSLLFDPFTHLLVAVLRGAEPSTYGDQVRSTYFGPYRRVGNTMVPETLAFRVNAPVLGEYERSLRLTSASIGTPTNRELAPPSGAQQRPVTSSGFSTEQLGRDVYLLRNLATEGQFSYNSLAVVFADHVVVVEAGVSAAGSARAIAEIARIAPGKPVRTLVQTHHHSDHIGGLRAYIAAGTTIVAPAGMRPLIDRIASTHSTVAPDALARSPKSARVEEVQGRRTIRDTQNEVRLFDLPSGHSAHMLVVYLPQQRVVYQGDLISAGEIPLNATGREFLEWLRKERLPVTALAGLHGRTVTGTELDDLLSEGELAASPKRAIGN